MKEAIQAFLKKPTTIVGIVTALMFQVIFSVIWMTGYNGVSDTERLKELKVGIVALDTQMGPVIAEQLGKSLPVQTVQVEAQDEALTMLNDRELQMVVTIPADFSQTVAAQDGTAKLTYSINESNAQMIKSVMNAMAAQITANVNKQAVMQGVQAVLTQANLPAEQAQGAAAALSERVTSEFNYSNVVEGQNNQMVPMMLVLASYVGSMLLAMNMENSSMALASRFNRWQRFGARSIISIVAAVFISLVGSSFVLMLGGQAEHGFLAMWGFQALFLLAFMFTAQLFLLLLGLGGMLLNIIMLSVQLVSSGAMLPRELLPDFYHGISAYLPATYAVEGMMDLLFGGPGVSGAVAGLLIIFAVAIVLGAGAVALRKPKAPQGTAQVA
ncbi:putative phage infection (PIP) family protein YhgE [Paenibacillus phyllosphaerae]|uniref:Putative phage infection (PIP) family protein YhgE n=1 Tax=Paenibacillus phyllosphaerae TaxID=274593 RepID=A0A7W5FP99_9BACL|nr:ABC transporter permease [Paenibacillus phyllosphaerae]MBB3112151.1 putative phage infection (PIP) family protein YhgE [Paenibacillus phyllosphaerae]